MSSESIRAFFKKVNEDKALAGEAAKIKTENQLISFAGNAGFEFSVQDIRHLKEEQINSKLKSISGGVYQGSDVPDTLLSLLTALKGGNPDSELE